MIHELKRYKIRRGQQEAFLDVWRPIATLRKKHGVEVPFAFLDRASGWFTWAVAHDDFQAAAQRYYADPDRVALEVREDYVEDHSSSKGEPVAIP